MLKSSRQKSYETATKSDNFPTGITVTVILEKPFGLRINKDDLRVTSVGSRCSSVGQVGVGDKIIAINYEKLQTIKDLNKQLSKPGKEARVTLERCGFSCCKHMITTVETLTVEKGSSLKVLRAIEVYLVLIRIKSFPELDLGEEFGLSVKYDNREQLQVASVIPGSLASIHLRPGDVIKQVNGEYITSKTMLAFWIRHGFITKSEIRILIQTGVEADMHIEMPDDVQYIAQKQLTTFKSLKSPKSMMSLIKKTNSSIGKHITISMEEPKVIEICSDYDERTLKRVQKSK
ncbi:unnamed protein product [Cercopithifilaria johnstoni]|uniref:PDZ domain-containing protein n=1 Tax=Cercopithifilaria johnstoni TaxID=2874296 RepID=A0A8J2LTD1_9BILA|nr:unnamed protein product [Cercopithifilaria johnstoni]